MKQLTIDLIDIGLERALAALENHSVGSADALPVLHAIEVIAEARKAAALASMAQDVHDMAQTLRAFGASNQFALLADLVETGLAAAVVGLDSEIGKQVDPGSRAAATLLARIAKMGGKA
jgi:hypothetical protein